LDLVKIHEQALITLLPLNTRSRTSVESSVKRHNGTLDRAARFFVKALVPLASNHRGALKANGELRRANGTMYRKTADLVDTSRQLKRETKRREVLEAALERSERHFGQLLERSNEMQHHLRRLNHQLLMAQEDERKKISRELHDEIGQTLTAINVRLSTLRNQVSTDASGLRSRIVSTQRLLQRSLNAVHQFARELRPPLLDDAGLVPALHSYMKSFSKWSHLPVQFTASAAPERLSSDVQIALYRVTQEALNNIVKHAQASLVVVRLQYLRNSTRLLIHDNGRSFQVDQPPSPRLPKRLGLLGMRERVEMVGGTFAIRSAPGEGTTVEAEIPFGTARPKSRTTKKTRRR
jgi:signal transduction histidine kinase